jgi:hypothetical protein
MPLFLTWYVLVPQSGPQEDLVNKPVSQQVDSLRAAHPGPSMKAPTEQRPVNPSHWHLQPLLRVNHTFPAAESDVSDRGCCIRTVSRLSFRSKSPNSFRWPSNWSSVAVLQGRLNRTASSRRPDSWKMTGQICPAARLFSSISSAAYHVTVSAGMPLHPATMDCHLPLQMRSGPVDPGRAVSVIESIESRNSSLPCGRRKDPFVHMSIVPDKPCWDNALDPLTERSPYTRHEMSHPPPSGLDLC